MCMPVLKTLLNLFLIKKKKDCSIYGKHRWGYGGTLDSVVTLKSEPEIVA